MAVIPYRNARGRTAEEIATIGGWWSGPSYFPGEPFPVLEARRKWADVIHAAKVLRGDGPNPVRSLLRSRVELPGLAWNEYAVGEQPEPGPEWEAAGFELQMPPAVFGGWTAGTVGHAYWLIDWERRTLSPRWWIADVSIDSYRTWACDTIACAAHSLGVDAVLLGFKEALYDTPEWKVYRPDGLHVLDTGEVVEQAQNLAPIWASCPYAPGSYAKGMAKAVRRIVKSVPVVVANSSPKPNTAATGPWVFMANEDPGFEARVVGEAAFVG
jgi:hypothetical protein